MNPLLVGFLLLALLGRKPSASAGIVGGRRKTRRAQDAQAAREAAAQRQIDQMMADSKQEAARPVSDGPEIELGDSESRKAIAEAEKLAKQSQEEMSSAVEFDLTDGEKIILTHFFDGQFDYDKIAFLLLNAENKSVTTLDGNIFLYKSWPKYRDGKQDWIHLHNPLGTLIHESCHSFEIQRMGKIDSVFKAGEPVAASEYIYSLLPERNVWTYNTEHRAKMMEDYFTNTYLTPPLGTPPHDLRKDMLRYVKEGREGTLSYEDVMKILERRHAELTGPIPAAVGRNMRGRSRRAQDSRCRP